MCIEGPVWDNEPHANAKRSFPERRSWLSRFPIHVVLFPLFFILSFYLTNILEFSLKGVVVPAVEAIGAATVLWGLLTLVLKKGRKSAVIVSVCVVLFFSFGHIQEVVPQFEFALLGLGIDRRFLLIFVFVIAAILAGFVIARSKWSWRVPTTLLNLLAMSLIAVVGVQFAVHGVTHLGSGNPADETQSVESAAPPSISGDRQLPNIYHIVMDAYARNDVLKKWYGYDNQPFLDYLTTKGFFIADKAKANYAHTHLSLASTLNMRHMYFPDKGTTQANMDVVRNLFYANEASRKLARLGYQIVYFSSGYSMTAKVEGAVHPNDEWLNEFERAVFLQGSQREFEAHRRRILYSLDHLADWDGSDKPVFVLTHVVCPHPPFVFDASGNPSKTKTRYQHSDGSHWYHSGEGTVRDYRERYVGQLRFMNTKLRGTIDSILLRSKRPTIIVLQGDHGPGSMLDWHSVINTNMPEKMTTLLAYHFPDADFGLLYNEISPVNTYRVIFRQFFGETYELLEDRSFFSSSRGIFYFVDVTDRADSWEGTPRAANSKLGQGPTF